MKHFAVAELVIEAGIKYDEILEVRIEHRRNEYASAIIRLQAETKEAESLCVGEKPTGITIKTNGENGNITIFSGVCSNFTAHEFDSYGEIIIEAKSLGYLFDRKNVSRKFRRPANVQELLAALLESYPESNITVRNNNIKLKKIEAQNDETDWEYLLRLAGTTNQILYDDITAVKPNLYIGMPGTSVSKAVLEELTEIHDLDEYSKVKGTVNKDADETEYVYHCYGVSDGIACVGQTYKNEIVIESVIWSDKGIIQHTVVTTDKNVKNSTYDNSPLNTSIKSCILSGTVVSIEGTHLQVALDVKTDLGNENDEKRKESFDANGINIKSEDAPGTSLKVDTKQKKSLVDVEKYVWISQESQYSNFFYSMPDIGDKVYIYYEEDRKAICLGSFHTNINDSVLKDDYSDPSVRTLEVQNNLIRFNKTALEMATNKLDYGYTRNDHKNKAYSGLSLDNKYGIEIHSSENVNITTKGVNNDIKISSGMKSGDGILNAEAGKKISIKVGASSITIDKDINMKTPIFGWKGDLPGTNIQKNSKPLTKTTKLKYHANGGEAVNIKAVEEIDLNKTNVSDIIKLTFDMKCSNLKAPMLADASAVVASAVSGGAASSGNADAPTMANPEKAKASLNATSEQEKEDCGDPINVVTGSLEVQHVDMVVRYTGGEFALTRYYESIHTNKGGMLGSKWLIGIDERLVDNGKDVDIVINDLHLEKFILKDGEYVSSRLGDKSVILTKTNDGFEFTDISDNHVIRKFNSDGHLVSKYDRSGNGYSIEYEQGLASKVVFSGGNSLTLLWEDDKLASITDVLERKVSYEYAGEFLTKMTCIDGGIIQYEYTPEGYIKRIIDQNGNSYVQNEFDRKGRVVRQVLSSGEEFVLFYDEVNKQNTFLTVSTDERIIYTYDVRRLPLKAIYSDDTYTETEYDANENIIFERDRKGNITSREYSADGKLLKEVTSDGLETTYEYDENGNLIFEADNAESERRFVCDASGNLLSVSSKIDNNTEAVISYVRDSYGRVLEEKDALGNISYYSYDTRQAGPVSYKNRMGEEYGYTYDVVGRRTEVRSEAGKIYYGYDANDHITYMEDANGNITRFAYDTMGNLVSATYPLSSDESEPDYRIKYDSLDKPVEVVDALGGIRRIKRDANGRIIERTGNIAGSVIKYEYGVIDQPEKVIYPDGGIEMRKYDVNQNLIKNIYPEAYKAGGENGAAICSEYDCMDRLVKVISPDGREIYRCEYDKRGLVVNEYSEDKGQYIYKYDLIGRKTEERKLLSKDGEEEKWSLIRFFYDLNGNVTREERYQNEQTRESADGRILSIVSVYDKENRVIEQTDGFGATVKYEYDGTGRLINQKQYHGDTVSLEKRYKYDAVDNITTVIEIGENAAKPKKTNIDYDANGNVIKIVSPLGHTVTREYDRLNRLVLEKRKGADGDIDVSVSYDYDVLSNVTKKTETVGNETKVTEYTYDINGEVCSIKYPDGSIRTLSRNLDGNRESIQTPGMYNAGKAIKYSYDVEGRVKSIVDVAGNILAAYGYDAKGNLSKITEADESIVNLTYDEAGRRISASREGGSSQKVTYSPWNIINSITDGNDVTTNFTLDAWGRISEIGLADGSTESYSYDESGRMLSSVDGNGNTVNYSYDGFDNVITRTDALGNTAEYKYDQEDNCIEAVDRNGVKTSMSYNMYGDLTRRVVCGDEEKQVESYGYTKDGLLSYAIGGGMRYDYKYDIMGRLLSKSASGKELISYTYDEDGNKIGQKDISGVETHYSYDLMGNLLNVTDDNNLIASYTYDIAGRKTSASIGNGILQKYAYTVDGNISSIFASVRKESGEETLLDNRYTYDNNGNMLSKQTLTGRSDYAYDLLGRLTSVKSVGNNGSSIESFTYDKAGNRLTREMLSAGSKILEEYRYDAGNRLLSVEKITRELESFDALDIEALKDESRFSAAKETKEDSKFSYDNAGNMLSDSKFDYSYDGFNRLVSAKGVEGSINAGKSQENHYDAEGLRHEMIENGRLVKFLFSGREVVAEEDEEQNVIRYVRGMGLIASDSEEARTYRHKKDTAGGDEDDYHYYVSEEVDSVRYILGGKENEILNAYEYDAFGNYIKCEEKVANRFGYTGQQIDAVTGQYYLRARFFNPSIGRFLQEDSYLGDGLNLWAYCNNNPLKYYDPSGNKGICKSKYCSIEMIKAMILAGDKSIEIDKDKTLMENALAEYKRRRAELDNEKNITAATVRADLEREFGVRYHSKLFDDTERFDNKAREIYSDVHGAHGNSKDSEKKNHVYVIVRKKNGTMIKVGISGQGFKANGDSKRAQPQVEKFKEIYGNSVEAIIIEKGLTREEALALEQKITDKHAVRNKGKMPTRYHQLPRPSVSNKDIYEERYSEAHNVSVKGRNY